MEKRLDQILSPSCTLQSLPTTGSIRVNGFQSDSRLVQPGQVFFSVSGGQTDGRRFIPQAIAAGAKAIVGAGTFDAALLNTYPDIAFVSSTHLMADMANLAASFYETTDGPCRLVGVTGTNGKTTTASLIYHVLRASGRKCFFIGTTGIEIGDLRLPTDYTTPPAFELHRLLHVAKTTGVTHGVMEVSSHGLKLERVHRLTFDVALFTNLTHEHAELHPSMDDYYFTKKKLFSMLKPEGCAIINTQDPYGQRLFDELSLAKKIAVDISRTTQTDTIETSWNRHPLRLPSLLPGDYNRINQLLALETLKFLGVDHESLYHGWMTFDGVEGRFEWYTSPLLDVIIDFAHTPDGLEKLLQAARTVARGELVCIFGCPGSRDRTKRPMMGRIASRLADRVIVTTDDIHHESPEAIIRDIMEGVTGVNTESIVDRRSAIRRGLEYASGGHTLIIAGRGHERFQYVGDDKVPFLDRDVLMEEAASRDITLEKKKGVPTSPARPT